MPETSMKPTICLNMIVKNEAHVIERCLASVKEFIDRWVIVDTGSTDGTQEKIRAALHDVAGKLVERPWVNFAQNRSEAILEAREWGDYLFILDADEVLTLDADFELPALDKDAYQVEILSGGVSYYKTQLINNRLNWCYKGVLHEFLYGESARDEAVLGGAHILRYTDGARSRDPLTYKKDALILEQALLEEPENSRYQFYLAQSYRDAQDLELALRHYERRAAMGGWREEVWYSLYQAADLKQRLGREWGEVLAAHLRAYQVHPKRIEPLFRIAMYYQRLREFATAHLFLKRAMELPYPETDRLFVEKSVYEYIVPMEYAVSAYWVGDDAEAIRVNNRLLDHPGLPGEIFEQVIKNRRFSLDRIHPPRKESDAETNPIVVVIYFQTAGAELDNTVESLLLQNYSAFEAIFVADGAEESSEEAIPVEDARIRLVRHRDRRGALRSIDEALSGIANRDTICVLLSADDWLDPVDALESVNRFFERYGCLAMWSQYRLANGRYGRAKPFADGESFAARTELQAGLRAFRIGLFDRLAESARAGLEGIDEVCDALLGEAGFERAAFNDQVLSIRGAHAREAATAALAG